MISFFVPARPVPQGNHRVNRYGAMYETSKDHAAWREVVTLMARRAMRGHQMFEKGVPIQLELEFFLPRGKTVKREEPTVPPDLSKLTRSVEDALSGICYDDDKQITREILGKCYALHTDEVGCRVSVKARGVAWADDASEITRTRPKKRSRNPSTT